MLPFLSLGLSGGVKDQKWEISKNAEFGRKQVIQCFLGPSFATFGDYVTCGSSHDSVTTEGRITACNEYLHVPFWPVCTISTCMK